MADIHEQKRIAAKTLAALVNSAGDNVYRVEFDSVDIGDLAKHEVLIVQVVRTTPRARVYDPVTVTQVFEPFITVTK